MENKKRKQFSDEEKSSLRELVLKYKTVVENKRSDVISLAEKKKGWETITAEFNAVGSHTYRTSLQLKKLWENIKFRRRSELAEVKRERLKTGGGGSYIPTISEDPELDKCGGGYRDPKEPFDCDSLASSEAYMLVDNVVVPVQHAELVTALPEEAVEVAYETEVTGTQVEPDEGILQRQPTSEIPSARRPSWYHVTYETEARQAEPEDVVFQAQPSTSGMPLTRIAGNGGTEKEVPFREELLKSERVELLMEQDAQLHSSRMEELQLKLLILRKQLELEEKKIEHEKKKVEREEKLFRMKQENLQIENDNLLLTKRSLTCKCQNNKCFS